MGLEAYVFNTANFTYNSNIQAVLQFSRISKTYLLLSKDESFETSKILITDQTTDMKKQNF